MRIITSRNGKSEKKKLLALLSIDTLIMYFPREKLGLESVFEEKIYFIMSPTKHHKIVGK